MRPAYLAAILLLAATAGTILAATIWGLIIAGLAILDSLIRMIGGTL